MTLVVGSPERTNIGFKDDDSFTVVNSLGSSYYDVASGGLSDEDSISSTSMCSLSSDPDASSSSSEGNHHFTSAQNIVSAVGNVGKAAQTDDLSDEALSSSSSGLTVSDAASLP